MPQHAKNKAATEATTEVQVTQSGPIPVIYTDRIINLGLGPAVSRLILAMEVGPNTFAPSLTLVIPTSALIDALEFMSKTLHENKEAKDGMIKTLDAIKEQFSKL
jgi:hypothetical protein